MVTGLSNHNLTLLARKFPKRRPNHPNTTTRKSIYKKILKADQCNFDGAINEINWSDLLTGTDVEADSHMFISTIQSQQLLVFKKKLSPGAKRVLSPG